ncbi:MAG: hypothetical protein FWG42_06305 [Clostridiales bacterium]|nr:hypothetical protein [Clostridiales bacterium]
MSTFNAEQGKTLGKMSDLVMEYISQFIARDFFEAYEKASRPDHHEFVPSEFDEKIYKKTVNLYRKCTGQNNRTLRSAAFFTAALICLSCVAFTVLVLSDGALRHEIFSSALSLLSRFL